MYERENADQEMQRAATAIQLSIAITETLEPAELGNDVYELLCAHWFRAGRSPEWISTAVDLIDDIKRITFLKDADQKWALAVEWDEE